MDNLEISKENYLNSYNFARRSNIVFTEILSIKEFEEIKNENHKIIYQEKNEVCYLNTNFKIYENDILFSNTDFIKILFKYLYKIKTLNNIKLITHWSDLSIDKNLFKKKPKCISSWFGTHINFYNSSLKALPLGLSGEYSTKNLTSKFFINSSNIKKEKKGNLLYLNFQKNTNEKERELIEDQLKNLDWVKYDQPTLTLNEYLNELKNSEFVLCPFGNGFDTHRLWETLYAGSIPIIKNHITYQTTENLPVLMIKNYEEINENFLRQKLLEIRMKNYENKNLDIRSWFNIINSIKKDSNEVIEIKISNFDFLKLKFSYVLSKFYRRQLKKIIFRLKQVLKIFR